MNISDFKRIVTSFADRQTDIELTKGQLLTEIRGELIEANLSTKEGVLFVQEKGVEENAVTWIRNRIACLPQLADRIIDFIPSEPHFIIPSGNLIDELEYDPEEREQPVPDTVNTLLDILSRKIPGTSSIVYLTSDAGEGKTTLINTLAKIQAEKFKKKKSDWLLVPIPLGGRPFLRFDDIVIASLVNNLRFRFFYYDSFIELVRIGLIVPAFDGFEEMFMQSSTGEALSATGGLLNKLNSSGTLLIAARKAYFEYKSFSSQAKLFDTISSSVTFTRLAIQRWTKEQFTQYASYKGISEPNQLYELLIDKLGDPNHPIITRAVLVKQLIDVFQGFDKLTDLISRLESASSYFPAFVHAIIEREANTKWIDTSGEPFKPILSISQHYDLLALLAEEMWLNNSESLKDSVIDLLTEIYSDSSRFEVQKNRQIKERIKQHALIVRTSPNTPEYKFDHEEFREFFLGISIAYKLISKQIIELKNNFRKAPFPQQSIDSAVHTLKSGGQNIGEIKTLFDDLTKGEGHTSFVRENVGSVILKLFNNEDIPGIKITDYEMSENSLKSVRITNVTFDHCHFQHTSLHSTSLLNCTFNQCSFDRLEFNDLNECKGVIMVECEIASIYDSSKDKGFYDPATIKRYLENKGITVQSQFATEIEAKEDYLEDDEDLELTEKALRRFMRSNHQINDNVFKLRLGSRADYFFRELLPDLLKHGILEEVEYIGQGRKRRFKLGTSFTKIEEALHKSKGNYDNFIMFFEHK
jgi:hypothetical protein